MAPFHRSLTPKRIMITTSVFFALLSLQPNAAALGAPQSGAGTSLPSEFGRIIYRTNPDHPFQVYIIGNSHRSPATGANGATTVQAQVETYRIGEWLINRRKVDLLLPEGFFGDSTEPAPSGTAEKLPDPPGLATPALQETLADTTSFVNADILLRRHYGIHLSQIEDRNLYRFVIDYLSEGKQNTEGVPPGFGRELDYLQQLRSAVILKNIPGVLEEAYRKGRIKAPRAIMTIGMTHLDEIIRFLEKGRIEIAPPHEVPRDLPAYLAALERLEKDFGVTVILPRTILENERIMRLSRLDLHPGTDG